MVRNLHIYPQALAVMKDDAKRTFPNECCGFFYGSANGQVRHVTLARPVVNQKDGDQRRHFEISPQHYMQAERFGLENNLDLLGVYHSHPNHPAVPSEQDRKQAMPWFSYVILQTLPSGIGRVASYTLDESRQFEEEYILSKVR